MGAKRFVPKVSLGTAVLAAQLADLLWPIFLLLGIERVRISEGITAFSPLDFEHFPITHSLLGITALSAVLAIVYFGITRYRAGAWAVGLLGVSHWILDVLVHRPDLLLIPGGDICPRDQSDRSSRQVWLLGTRPVAPHHLPERRVRAAAPR